MAIVTDELCMFCGDAAAYCGHDELYEKHKACDEKLCRVDAPRAEWSALAKECREVDGMKRALHGPTGA